MTLAQAQWAEGHDWYVEHYQSSNGWIVVIESAFNDGRSDLEISNFDDLQDWAGY